MEGSIGDDINFATKHVSQAFLSTTLTDSTRIRSYHTTLNQLVLHFLPFSLPPYSSNHHLYALGISQFHPLYLTFESTFRDHIRSEDLPPRTTSMLQKLYLPDLERAEALEYDLKTLLPPSHCYHNTADRPRLEAFKQHIQISLTQKPHLLSAYTWIFYMALFSGGRYIRSKLRAGLTPPNPSLPQRRLDELSGLSFWNFPGDADGEDLKIDFKNRVAALSATLTEEERSDIIKEGVQIMVFLTDVVREVSETVPTQAIKLAAERTSADTVMNVKGPVARIRPPWILLLRNFFPMGFMDLLSAAMGTVVPKAPEHDGVATRTAMHVHVK
ncbi:MAG: hypothetical protein Q9201_007975 [Fulgogasparrea decipioides]